MAVVETLLDGQWPSRPPSVWVVELSPNGTGTVTVLQDRLLRTVRSRCAALMHTCTWCTCIRAYDAASQDDMSWGVFMLVHGARVYMPMIPRVTTTWVVGDSWLYMVLVYTCQWYRESRRHESWGIHTCTWCSCLRADHAASKDDMSQGVCMLRYDARGCSRMMPRVMMKWCAGKSIPSFKSRTIVMINNIEPAQDVNLTRHLEWRVDMYNVCHDDQC
jgi:hypothetical protein